MAQQIEHEDIYRSTRAIHDERRQTLLDRYGGFSWGSGFIGFVVASFFTLVLFGVVGAIVGTVGYQLNAPVPKVGGHISQTTTTLGIGGLVGGLVALFIAYLIGGYVAGRMARFDGAKQGVGVVIWTIILALALGIAGAAAGSRFDVAKQLNLKIDAGTLTTAGAVSLAVALIVMFVAAIIGGTMGVNFHRKIDEDSGVAH